MLGPMVANRDTHLCSLHHTLRYRTSKSLMWGSHDLCPCYPLQTHPVDLYHLFRLSYRSDQGDPPVGSQEKRYRPPSGKAATSAWRPLRDTAMVCAEHPGEVVCWGGSDGFLRFLFNRWFIVFGDGEGWYSGFPTVTASVPSWHIIRPWS